jgi:hypothetical protein
MAEVSRSAHAWTSPLQQRFSGAFLKCQGALLTSEYLRYIPMIVHPNDSYDINQDTSNNNCFLTSEKIFSSYPNSILIFPTIQGSGAKKAGTCPKHFTHLDTYDVSIIYIYIYHTYTPWHTYKIIYIYIYEKTTSHVYIYMYIQWDGRSLRFRIQQQQSNFYCNFKLFLQIASSSPNVPYRWLVADSVVMALGKKQ